MTDWLESARLAAVRKTPSVAARERLLALPGEPLFVADWERALMIHYEVAAEPLQREVPFKLDRRDGRAFVSIVAFTMSGLRPRLGRRLATWLLKPIGTHNFLNVRTYVQHSGETGIYFLAEWLSNRLSVAFGPRMFGLPYRFGRLDYQHGREQGDLRGHAADPAGKGVLAYRAVLDARAKPAECEAGTLDEWLMERYTAFTHVAGKAGFFRVWHQPWPQVRASATVTDQGLLGANWPFLRGARIVGANFSPGVFNVWMGWPHRLPQAICAGGDS